ncbi:hypothetical protein BC936DRAFT_141363 [Jimgerdemannia flammicorona]|uniref:Uncharacterized protein n=1 Tax=Jimgerdemannia flammicorona TaxID=994334 RepID=A0A433A2D3_9FUNG|nr:hypothetical protein BC936DRAFT_141363 [Jimgerdemannia flammicorona]
MVASLPLAGSAGTTPAVPTPAVPTPAVPTPAVPTFTSGVGISASIPFQILLEYLLSEDFALLETELGDDGMEEFGNEALRYRQWFRRLTSGG